MGTFRSTSRSFIVAIQVETSVKNEAPSWVIKASVQ
jgi:hypothetical protein